MKKLFLCAAIAVSLLACKSKDEPENLQKQQVTFKVTAFEQSTEPMNSPRKAPQATIRMTVRSANRTAWGIGLPCADNAGHLRESGSEH